MRVAVTDGNSRAALAITRSLGKAGYWVAVGAETRRSLAGASRYCAKAFHYSSPLANVRESMEGLAREVRRLDIDCLIPVTDMTLIPLLDFRESLFANIKIPYPPRETVLRTTDKFSLFQLAQECDVPIPRTVFVHQSDCPLEAFAKIQEYPVIIKPSRSVYKENDHLMLAGVSYVFSKEELLQLIKKKDYLQRYPFLVQERVFGDGVGYFALLEQGKLIAEFSHRRIREKPPTGGVSVFSESIAVRSDIRDYSLRLLNALGWSGVAMVEYKLDRRTNTPQLMEINGRFWGSLQLSVRAGVDFPCLLLNSSSNGSNGAPSYKLNLRWRWLLGDLDNLLLRCLKQKNLLLLPPGHPSRLRAVTNFVLAFGQRNVHYDVLCREDMAPFLYEVRSYICELLK